MNLFISAGTPQHCALRALGARLYDRGGGLKSTLRDITKGTGRETVVLLSDEKQRVYGTAVLTTGGQLMVYVVPELRGKGWGGKLVMMAKVVSTVPPDKQYAMPGANVVDSSRFWKNSKVQCKHFEGGIAMTSKEAGVYVEQHGRVLICRESDNLGLDTIEALYIQQLYTNEYSDDHDGLRGQLACIINEKYSTVDFILFHLFRDFVSCATVCERKQDVEGDSKKVVVVQLFVSPDHRKQGLGQEILDKVKDLYPRRALFGYYTPTSTNLFERNGVLDFRSVS